MNKTQLYEIIKEMLGEAHWGGFTVGAAPLDEPPLDSGPMSPEQQQKVFDILVDTGSDPEELKASGDFPDVIEENIMNIKNIIREELQTVLNEQPRGVSDLLKSADMIRWHLGAIAGDAEDLGKLSRWQKSIDEMLTAQDFEKADEALTSYIEKLGGFVQELSTAHKELQLLKNSLK